MAATSTEMMHKLLIMKVSFFVGLYNIAILHLIPYILLFIKSSIFFRRSNKKVIRSVFSYSVQLLLLYDIHPTIRKCLIHVHIIKVCNVHTNFQSIARI